MRNNDCLCDQFLPHLTSAASSELPEPEVQFAARSVRRIVRSAPCFILANIFVRLVATFRNRIGAAGFEKILAASIALHGDTAIAEEMGVDTTVQEKNITFPSAAKQYCKIHAHLRKPARAEGIKLARTHEQEVKRLQQRTRFASHPRNRIGDRGYRGKTRIGEQRIIIPGLNMVFSGSTN